MALGRQCSYTRLATSGQHMPLQALHGLKWVRKWKQKLIGCWQSARTPAPSRWQVHLLEPLIPIPCLPKQQPFLPLEENDILLPVGCLLVMISKKLLREW